MRRLAAAVALVALAGTLAACGGDDGGSPRDAPSPQATSGPSAKAGVTPRRPVAPPQSPDVAGSAVPRDLAAAFTRLLDRRAAALRGHDRRGFLRGVDRSVPGFARSQADYYANIAQLPVATLSYDLEPTSLVRTGDDYWVVVQVALQLEGYDAVPVRSYDRYRFSTTRRGGVELSSVTDPDWEAANGATGQPWDRRPVVVREQSGVLGVFDARTAGAAGPVVDALAAGVADVRARVPYDWDGRVVVYALGDLDFMSTLESLPGGDATALDGVAFSVPAGAGDPTVADVRVVLNPSVLTRPAVVRDRLLRHELTHVAVGGHDAGVPAWVSEGTAEWVSVQRLPAAERKVSAVALREARRGELRTMPDDASFNDDQAQVHYALAWWVCQYLAATYGPQAPWTVLDALAGVEDPDKVLQRLVRLDADQLARRGAKLMVATYAPRPSPSPPDPSPSTPAPSRSPSPRG